MTLNIFHEFTLHGHLFFDLLNYGVVLKLRFDGESFCFLFSREIITICTDSGEWTMRKFVDPGALTTSSATLRAPPPLSFSRPPLSDFFFTLPPRYASH